MRILNTPELIISAQGGDKNALDTMISENMGLVHSIAGRFLGRGAELDDLVQIGSIGLYKAVTGFDVNYGTQFSTYAVPKIVGEIRRFLRDDGMLKVSRNMRETAAAIGRARQKLMSQLDREPLLSELSAETGISPEDISEAELSCLPVDSLQREQGEDGLALEGLVGDEGPEEAILDKLSVREIMAELPENEAKVLCLRYVKGLTQEQTARIIGVSQVQISRIQKKAIAHMREGLSQV